MNNKGITLITVIIMIILLLILASITLNFTFDEKNFDRASNIVEKSESQMNVQESIANELINITFNSTF